ncbi:hypothetical protein BOX15_Mlig022153g1 [Macrostomum lignano]|uniref:Transcriptional adapter 1-like protein n=1 Tax=Macrostomum lignano TaxID=282301 RepID=A0A267DZ39_9PLAT|nr:hypothetical protein BOX15_Mlig022153g1 [Macrostomum lignano]
MTDSSNFDSVLKQRLQSELKENYFWYMTLLHRWFQNQISKEEFDKQAKNLFLNSDVTSHNQFMLHIMSSDCKLIESSAPLTKSLRHRFVEVPQVPLISLIADYKQETNGSASNPCTPAGSQGTFDRGCRKDFSVVTTSCMREQRLPGAWMMYGRAMHTLNLYSLQDFSPDTLNCLALATQCFIKKVLLSALATRKSCRILAVSDSTSASTTSSSSRGLGNQFRLRNHLQQHQQYRRLGSLTKVWHHSRRSRSRLVLERGAFGAARAPPMAPLSMRDGYAAPSCGAELNAYSHAARLFNHCNGNNSSSSSYKQNGSIESQRVEALLRCGSHAQTETQSTARVQDSGEALASSTPLVTVLTLEDLDRVLSRPDSLGVGYHCVQRQRPAVSSALLRCLSRSRLLSRLRQRQPQDSSSQATALQPPPALHPPTIAQQREHSTTHTTTPLTPGSRINQTMTAFSAVVSAPPPHSHPITNGRVCVMETGGDLADLVAGDVPDGYEDCLM